MRGLAIALLALVFGAYVMRAHDADERTQLQLASARALADVQIKAAHDVECAFHEGSDEGYRTGMADGQRRQ